MKLEVELDEASSARLARSSARGPELNEIEKRLRDLRSKISDLGDEVDRHKAKTAAAMGGGLFLFLLALLGGYDLVAGKGALWAAIGATERTLYYLTCALVAASLALFVAGLLLRRGRDRGREARLEALEEEYARLLDRKDAYLS
jgi:hypothetical protein